MAMTAPTSTFAGEITNARKTGRAHVIVASRILNVVSRKATFHARSPGLAESDPGGGTLGSFSLRGTAPAWRQLLLKLYALRAVASRRRSSRSAKISGTHFYYRQVSKKLLRSPRGLYGPRSIGTETSVWRNLFPENSPVHSIPAPVILSRTYMNRSATWMATVDLRGCTRGGPSPELPAARPATRSGASRSALPMRCWPALRGPALAGACLWGGRR